MTASVGSVDGTLRSQLVGHPLARLVDVLVRQVGVALGRPWVGVPRQLLEHRPGDPLARHRRRQEGVAVVIEDQLLAVLIGSDPGPPLRNCWAS